MTTSTNPPAGRQRTTVKPQTTTVDVWVLVDACGDYAVGKDAAAAREQYAADIGPVEDCDGFRLVKLALTVPLPAVIEAAAEVTEDGAELALAVA